MNFLKSLKNAFKGIIYCISSEINMRIHTVVALYVLIFSRYFNLSFEKYIILFLTIGFVFSFELLNTCIEKMTDALIDKYDINVKIIKDLCAGSVLVVAITALIVGVFIFGDIKAIFLIFNNVLLNIKNLISLVFLTVISTCYIKLGPIGIKNQLYKIITAKR